MQKCYRSQFKRQADYDKKLLAFCACLGGACSVPVKVYYVYIKVFSMFFLVCFCHPFSWFMSCAFNSIVNILIIIIWWHAIQRDVIMNIQRSQVFYDVHSLIRTLGRHSHWIHVHVHVVPILYRFHHLSCINVAHTCISLEFWCVINEEFYSCVREILSSTLSSTCCHRPSDIRLTASATTINLGSSSTWHATCDAHLPLNTFRCVTTIIGIRALSFGNFR